MSVRNLFEHVYREIIEIEHHESWLYLGSYDVSAIVDKRSNSWYKNTDETVQTSAQGQVCGWFITVLFTKLIINYDSQHKNNITWNVLHTTYILIRLSELQTDKPKRLQYKFSHLHNGKWYGSAKLDSSELISEQIG